jgi:hypothetical protein
MRDLQEAVRTEKTKRKTKKAQRPRTHLVISLTTNISNHIQSPIILHIGSTIVQVDHSTIHPPSNDAQGTIAENAPNVSYTAHPIFGSEGIGQ